MASPRAFLLAVAVASLVPGGISFVPSAMNGRLCGNQPSGRASMALRVATGLVASPLRPLSRRCASRISSLSMQSSGSPSDDLSKKFEQEKETRIKMDKIFEDATQDLSELAGKEMEELRGQSDELLKQREEEWEALGNKETEALIGKVDSLAENFLKKSGRSVDDDDDVFGEMERYLGPSVVALIGEKSAMRDDLQKRMEEHPALTISSCERLLETRGLTIENTDTLVFCGDGDPLDRKTVERLVSRALKLRRVVVVSSVGTERANLFPFSLQNALTGSLDKKRGVELGVIEQSKKTGFAYTVLRLGKVSGASTSGGPKGVVVAYGDQNSEDVASDVAAESVMQALMLQPSALNCSLSVVGGSKGAEGEVSQAKWDDEFLKLEGPEVWRRDIPGVSVEACRTYVQGGWSARWGQSGSGLTTPVRIEEIKDGIALIFTPTTSNFVSFKEEKAAEKARERGEEDKEGKARQVPKDAEGGIEVVVESDPVPRVRARRCNMAEETVVKETSEGIILANLAKEIGAWVKENGGR